MKKSTFLLIILAWPLFLLVTHVSLAQTTVVVPGNFQSEMGCPGDWMPDCDLTRLTATNPGLWEGTFYLPAGSWMYKIAYDNSWSENYGEGGIPYGPDIPLYLATPAFVHFFFSTETHLVVATPQSSPIKVAGNFQDELGCGADWAADCDATALAYDNGSNRWFGLLPVPSGTWEYKIVHNNSWDENYGEGGLPNGAAITLEVADDRQILFWYDPITHITATTPVDSMVTLTGDIQTALLFDGSNNLWTKKLTLPQGSYQFKVALDSAGAVNYGEGGVPDGAPYAATFDEPSVLTFTYQPASHILNWTTQSVVVTLPGSFQALLGCSGDWDPGCNVTQLHYDINTSLYSGTFEIPAGYYEYKVAINNSWEENYGADGTPHGPNIPLYLEGDATITFFYDPLSHYVTLQFSSSTLCVNVFYDANANGYPDEYSPLEGVAVRLDADSVHHEGFTSAEGLACFTDLATMPYLLTTEGPPSYKLTTYEEQYVYPYGPSTAYVGMVCLGEAGAESKGFWTSRLGKRAFESTPYNESILYSMSYLNLRNPNGSLFTPGSYDQLAVWMKQASGRNMSNLLSAELAAFVLNIQTGKVDGSRMVYAPGFGYYANGNFVDGYSLMRQVGSYLSAYPVSKGGDNSRPMMEKLKDILENANGDRTFVQLEPCTAPVCKEWERDRPMYEHAKLWPNPTATNFRLKVPFSEADGPVSIQVFDRYNNLVFTTQGNASEEFIFGDNLPAGMYFVRIEQGADRVDVKAIKK